MLWSRHLLLCIWCLVSRNDRI